MVFWLFHFYLWMLLPMSNLANLSFPTLYENQGWVALWLGQKGCPELYWCCNFTFEKFTSYTSPTPLVSSFIINFKCFNSLHFTRGTDFIKRMYFIHFQKIITFWTVYKKALTRECKVDKFTLFMTKFFKI